jgi:signal peptidase II
MRQVRGGVEISGNMKIFAVAGGSVVLLDQLTKLAIVASLAPYEIIETVPGFFNIVHYLNPGAAFGILNRSGFTGKLLLIGISIAALVIIATIVRSSKERLYTFALSLIAGGAAGNLIDRIRQGSVVDFLDFHIGGLHWPAFNVADMAISAGVGLAFLSFFFSRKSES